MEFNDLSPFPRKRTREEGNGRDLKKHKDLSYGKSGILLGVLRRREHKSQETLSKFRFYENGDIDDGEIVAILKL